jgi:hypothetical protein
MITHSVHPIKLSHTSDTDALLLRRLQDLVRMAKHCLESDEDFANLDAVVSYLAESSLASECATTLAALTEAMKVRHIHRPGAIHGAWEGTAADFISLTAKRSAYSTIVSLMLRYPEEILEDGTSEISVHTPTEFESVAEREFLYDASRLADALFIIYMILHAAIVLTELEAGLLGRYIISGEYEFEADRFQVFASQGGNGVLDHRITQSMVNWLPIVAVVSYEPGLSQIQVTAMDTAISFWATSNKMGMTSYNAVQSAYHDLKTARSRALAFGLYPMDFRAALAAAEAIDLGYDTQAILHDFFPVYVDALCVIHGWPRSPLEAPPGLKLTFHRAPFHATDAEGELRLIEQLGVLPKVEAYVTKPSDVVTFADGRELKLKPGTVLQKAPPAKPKKGHRKPKSKTRH